MENRVRKKLSPSPPPKKKKADLTIPYPLFSHFSALRNTFASAYWRFRFVCQCIFYFLVMTVTLVQVYYPKPSELYGAYFPIVVFSVIFLWLEFRQFLRSPLQYITSPYNILDLIVYSLPLAGGIGEIVQGDAIKKATRVWSFAILFIYIHIVS